MRFTPFLRQFVGFSGVILAVIAVGLSLNSDAPPVAVVLSADESSPASSRAPALIVRARASHTPADTGYGVFTGQILLDGKTPGFPPLVGDKDERNDLECCRDNIPDERLIVDAKSSGIQNVFVYLQKVPAIHPDLRTSSQREVHVRAEHCRYIPHAVLARTDQVILFNVADSCAHTAHAFPLRNASYCSAISLADRAFPLQYKIAEREPFPVRCDIHPWMNARWLILDHPYSAITDEAGRFRIEKLPAEDHKFIVWHEAAGHIDKELSVDIEANKTTAQPAIKVPLERFKL